MNEMDHENKVWVDHFYYEPPVVHHSSVSFEGGHDSTCGCSQFSCKRHAQLNLIAKLEQFISQCEVAADDARVRVAQIRKAMETS